MSFDLVRSLLALGSPEKELAKVIASGGEQRVAGIRVEVLWKQKMSMTLFAFPAFVLYARLIP